MTRSRRRCPNWKALNDVPVSKALASIPDISTFNSAVSGGLNPEVNITSVLDNGPYVVFAPTNEAFAALTPAARRPQGRSGRADQAGLLPRVPGPAGPRGRERAAARPRRAPRSRSTARAATSRSTTPPSWSAAGSRPRTHGSTSSTRCSTRRLRPEPLTPTVSGTASTTTTTTTTETVGGRGAPERRSGAWRRGARRITASAAYWLSRRADASRRTPADPPWRPRNESAFRSRAWSCPSRARHR